jgi:hypothetical protein
MVSGGAREGEDMSGRLRVPRGAQGIVGSDVSGSDVIRRKRCAEGFLSPWGCGWGDCHQIEPELVFADPDLRPVADSSL